MAGVGSAVESPSVHQPLLLHCGAIVIGRNAGRTASKKYREQCEPRKRAAPKAMMRIMNAKGSRSGSGGTRYCDDSGRASAVGPALAGDSEVAALYDGTEKFPKVVEVGMATRQWEVRQDGSG
jgi:hypothetical protein